MDASIAVKWAVKTEPFRSRARAFLANAGANGIRLIAPPCFVAEVDSAMRKCVFDGKMSITEARKAYSILDAAPVIIVDVPGARQRARAPARALNNSISDSFMMPVMLPLPNCEAVSFGQRTRCFMML